MVRMPLVVAVLAITIDWAEASLRILHWHVNTFNRVAMVVINGAVTGFKRWTDVVGYEYTISDRGIPLEVIILAVVYHVKQVVECAVVLRELK